MESPDVSATFFLAIRYCRMARDPGRASLVYLHKYVGKMKKKGKTYPSSRFF
jgi:hypothetical protein